ncbi:MAG: site-2 protease family protein, partial [bacterium]
MQRKSPTIHILLFLATLATTTAAGALQRGASLLSDPASITLGLPFSLTLLLILFCHEMGHYICARYHGIETTLPYFIPGPPFLIGTFGALIKMQGMPRNRSALFDVGAAGPWAGMIVALPAVAIGLSWSEVHPLAVGADAPFALGSSMLFTWLGKAIL